MTKTRQQKEEAITNITDKLGRAKSVVFADYKGMTMSQLSDLRDKLRDQSAEFSVTKNTLLKIALSTNYKLPTTDLFSEGKQSHGLFEGPIATLFAYDDEVSSIKALVKALKDSGVGRVKAGFLGDEFLAEAKVNQLASLPTKDELRGKTVGVLVAPLQGIVGVLQANLRNLVYALHQIQIRQLAEKGGE